MTNLAITQIRTDRDDASTTLTALRQRLSPQGDVVSEAGRARTLQVFGEALSPRQVVETICQHVKQRGLAAVLDYTQRLDGAELTGETLRVSPAELATAHAQVQQQRPGFLQSVRRIRDRIWAFQQTILHHDARLELPRGGYLAECYRPLERVGICVPGGAAAYPSSLLMTAVPAQVAGVDQIAVIAPPTPFGSYNLDLLATCQEIGIQEIYRLGGAQGVAALAYGLENLPPVRKIVGPGNLFVALAKGFVFGTVGIDSISGPSEIVIVASGSAPASYVAADLIAQAEHSPGSSLLLTWSEPLWEDVLMELEGQLALADRGNLARDSLEEFGALILCRDANEACQIATEFAPEHLHIAAEDPEVLLEKIPTAGAAFLGPYSPVAVGDYVAGPSHVLPTSGTACFAHGLTANDFRRPHSIISYSPENLLEVADDLEQMAKTEGLTAHWQSVQVRLPAARQQAQAHSHS